MARYKVIWTPPNVMRLRRFWASNLTVREIAAKMGLPPESIYSKAWHLNLRSELGPGPLRPNGWTVADVETLVAGVKEGLSRDEISADLGRSSSAVWAAMRRFGLTRPKETKTANPQRRERKCLSCGDYFMSDGPGYRKCPKCERSHAGSNFVDFSVMAEVRL